MPAQGELNWEYHCARLSEWIASSSPSVVANQGSPIGVPIQKGAYESSEDPR